MELVILKGREALSEFRISALLKLMRTAGSGVTISDIKPSYVYFIEAAHPLSSDVMKKVSALLDTDLLFDKPEGFFVTPRKGTISPWSSKATDIFHNCGLNDVSRVERGIFYQVLDENATILSIEALESVLFTIYDRMTEGVYSDVHDIFLHPEPVPCVTIDVLGGGISALKAANSDMGLALSDEEIKYLHESYLKINRNPTDVELVMFGQVNSEHCRHKIFNANWIIDGEKKEESLFGMIRNTHEKNPSGTIVAYKDNSGVIEGFDGQWFEVGRTGENAYGYLPCKIDMIVKVETHNHPTAISPYPGAATGTGGEIRDEGATGVGSKPKAGLCAFMVSNLKVPDFIMPWEKEYPEFPDRLATPLEIMLEGPIGAARFGNEFGRPQLTGLFKTYEEEYNGRYRGYHKPIMVAGGMGNIKRIHVDKKEIPDGSCIVQIGGPAMKIGLGGGAASSMATGSNAADLDFDSVQRGNAEMQRRCQEVIDACIAMGEDNPILSIHDIGAGGLSNGCPELVADSGGLFHLREIHNEDMSMSPMEIWCCEAQERYVLAVEKDSLEKFLNLCERERCLVAVIGVATGDGHLTLEDDHFNNKPIDIDLGVILGKPPKMLREVSCFHEKNAALDLSKIEFSDAVDRILHLPSVANKTFLITIADRSVTGMVTRDQMVGPYQVPVSDVAVTSTSYTSYTGESMAMGERTNIALISAPASGRMAIGEALTNIAAANTGDIGNVKLSANWMCACGEKGEDAALYDTVKAVGMEFCPALGVSIPVGKDSLSMRTVWETSKGSSECMVAPLSLVVSSFSPVLDVRKTVTPDLKAGDSQLILIDLGAGRNRLACSALARVFNVVGDVCPDVDDPLILKNFFMAIQELIGEDLIMAYHDRSDGGLFVTLTEMAIASRRGISVNIDGMGDDPFAVYFSEELGAVIQVSDSNIDRVNEVLAAYGLAGVSRNIANLNTDSNTIELLLNGESIYSAGIADLNRKWSELTYRMQSYRDNPDCAKDEYDLILDENDSGINFKLTFDPDSDSAFNITETKPRVAILREQGVNGHVEMAAAFQRAGFESIDLHMTDLLGGNFDLTSCLGLVACGGFSYGDVLGAGSGWAKSVLFNEKLKELFAAFFERENTFGLGVCNGCQMMSQLKSIIPGANDWPDFTGNRSEQFEARYVTVEISESPSIFFKDMVGSRLAIPVAHGEGFADFKKTGSLSNLRDSNLIALRYIDNNGLPTERYPLNPNGSPEGVTGVTSADGRVTIMMPHPERVFRSVQMSYRPRDMFNQEAGPWLRMFQNARMFVS